LTAIPNSLGDYLSDLNSATSAEECMTVTRRHVGRLGFQNVVFAYVQREEHRRNELKDYLRYSSIPKAWENRYREMEYQNHCPIYREGLRGGSLPMIWQEIWDRTEMSLAQQQMVDEAGELGVVHGVTIPVMAPNGDRCGIGISTDLNDAEAGQVIEAQLPQVFLMSHHLYTVITERFWNQRNVQEVPRLTASELDCLHWVAEGKGTWEISEIQGISENTVKYHLRNILAKLDAANRAAAVAKAFRLGLLLP